MGKYYTLNERIKIETLLENKFTPKEIADQLGRHYTSVYREIKRGTVTLIDTHLKPYQKYCADVGQQKMEDASHNKGIDLKIKNDLKTVKAVENYIKVEKYSPYVISRELSTTSSYTPLSESTIYNYIHNGILLNVTENDMIYKSHKKKQETEKRVKYNKTGMKSIEERPKEISKRKTFGHWEMDTVYSGKDKSKSCLLVLSERMTRQELMYKIKDRTAQSVLDTINAIENKIGFEKFRNIFKTNNYQKFQEELKEKYHYEIYKPRKYETLGEFMHRHKTGRFIILLDDHSIAYINGTWYDSDDVLKYADLLLTREITFIACEMKYTKYL